MTLDLSVITLTWDQKDLTRGYLQMLQKNLDWSQRIKNYEVILVDNGSTDGTAQMIREEFPGVKLIANQENRGFAGGNNQALKIIQGEFVILLNNDVVVKDDALGQMLDFLCQRNEVGAVGPQLLNKDGSLQISAHQFPNFYRHFLEINAWYRPMLSMHQRTGPVDWVSGAALMVRKGVIEKVGLLDEAYNPVYVEETDWQYRMKKAGYQVYYLADQKIIHWGGASMKGTQLETKALNLQFDHLDYFLRKEYPWLSQKLTILASKLGVGLMVWRLKGKQKEKYRKLFARLSWF